MSKKAKAKSPTRPPLPQKPSGFPRWLVLGLLALVAFGATYAVTLLMQQDKKASTSLAEKSKLSPGETVAKATPQAKEVSKAPTTKGAPGMVWIPPGEFLMGSDSDKPRERNEQPVHPVRVDGFWMDETEVTNAQFRQFVEATKYVTTAEKAIDWEEMKKQLPPGTPKPPDYKMSAGALVFAPPGRKVEWDDISKWWQLIPEANWKQPLGPRSTIEGKDNHPVVQVSWDDAVAYAKWAGKRLPTEAEWEYAARGGLIGKRFIWGDEPPTDDSKLANIWQGTFPHDNTQKDGFSRTAPVKSFKPNGYGLYDMAGNVWEWCSDWYRQDAYSLFSPYEVAVNPQGPRDSLNVSLRTMRGGSFLCHVTYCESYRPSARRGSPPDTGTSHIGFRCVKE